MKSIIITGATSGIDYECAIQIAKLAINEQIIIACRNLKTGNETIEVIKHKTGHKNIICLPLDLELSVINPVGIFGPSLGPDISSGFELLRNLLNGSMKAVPNLTMNIIDVRDVADLHIRSMINPEAKGQRFLALAGGKISMPEIALLIKKKMPEVAHNISTKRFPDWLVSLTGLFSPQAKNIASMLRANRNTSNAKAREILGWKPLSNNEEAIMATIESMVKYKVI